MRPGGVRLERKSVGVRRDVARGAWVLILSQPDYQYQALNPQRDVVFENQAYFKPRAPNLRVFLVNHEFDVLF